MEIRFGSKASFLLLSLAVSLLSACGRENTVYSDDKGAAIDSITIRDGRSLLPKGFLDQSTGDGRVEIVEAGTVRSVVRFTGARAVLGITNYESLKLSEFSIEVQTQDTKPLTVALLIDRTCAGSSIETIVAETSAGLTSLVDEVLNESPNACLKNGVTDIDGLPTLPVGAVLLMNGSPSSSDATVIELKTLKLNSDTFTTWGAQ